MKVNTTPQTLEHVERVIKKNCSTGELISLRRNIYEVQTFPNAVPDVIKDYIKAHFEYLDQDESYSIVFRYERDQY